MTVLELLITALPETRVPVRGGGASTETEQAFAATIDSLLDEGEEGTGEEPGSDLLDVATRTLRDVEASDAVEPEANLLQVVSAARDAVAPPEATIDPVSTAAPGGQHAAAPPERVAQLVAEAPRASVGTAPAAPIAEGEAPERAASAPPAFGAPERAAAAPEKQAGSSDRPALEVRPQDPAPQQAEPGRSTNAPGQGASETVTRVAPPPAKRAEASEVRAADPRDVAPRAGSDAERATTEVRPLRSVEAVVARITSAESQAPARRASHSEISVASRISDSGESPGRSEVVEGAGSRSDGGESTPRDAGSDARLLSSRDGGMEPRAEPAAAMPTPGIEAALPTASAGRAESTLPGSPAPQAAGTPQEALPLHVEWLAARGGGTARIRLHPPHLGAVDLSVTLRGNAVDVAILAHEPAAQILVRDGREQLADALSARDLRMEQFEVSGDARERGEGELASRDPRDPGGGEGRFGSAARGRVAGAARDSASAGVEAPLPGTEAPGLGKSHSVDLRV